MVAKVDKREQGAFEASYSLEPDVGVIVGSVPIGGHRFQTEADARAWIAAEAAAHAIKSVWWEMPDNNTN
jgi:hypothetical protein